MKFYAEKFGEKFKVVSADYNWSAYLNNKPQSGDVIQFRERGGAIIPAMAHTIEWREGMAVQRG